MTRSLLNSVLVLSAALAGACATSRAQIPEQPPTLAVPPVPPRAIESAAIVEPPPDPQPVDPPPAPAPTPSRAGRPRPPAAEAKPDPKDVPVDTLPVAPPPPVAPLRSATTPTGPEAARQVREIIDGTQKMLDGVSSLGTDDRKANFQSAKALLVQAEEALKKDELTLARSFADRANNIAKLLLTGR